MSLPFTEPLRSPCSPLRLHEGSRIAQRCVCCGSDSFESSPAILMPFIADRVFGWKPLEIDASWGLRTVKSGTAYALCNTLLCMTCELLFLDLRFSDEELSRLYRDYRGPEYTRLREHYEPGYTERDRELARPVAYLRKTEEYLRPHVSNLRAVLDWGGDTGLNTPLKADADSVEIYDISGKHAGGDTSVSSLDRLQGKSFDLVTCCNVLEHVPYPAKVLSEIRHFMQPCTKLFIEVPFENLLQESSKQPLVTRKKHWHEHINFFSESSLRHLLRNEGFVLSEMRIIATNESGNQSHVFQIVCH